MWVRTDDCDTAEAGGCEEGGWVLGVSDHGCVVVGNDGSRDEVLDKRFASLTGNVKWAGLTVPGGK